MTFVNPAFLWALPLGLIPIIIYYLMRFRSLNVTWGANYVLERALARYKKKIFMEQLLLLALRVVACLLLALIFARPTSSGPGTSVSGGGVHRVIVVDASYSMLAADGQGPRWKRAKSAMAGLASSWGRGENWSVFRIGAKNEWFVDRATVETSEKTVAKLESLETDESRAVLVKALEEVAAHFPKEDVELYLFADDQAATWAGMESFVWPSSGRAKFYWVNPPLQNRRNLALTSLRPAYEMSVVGHPCRVGATVKNFSAEAVKDAEVEILVDGAFFGKETVTLLPGQESPLHFDVTFDKPGSHHVGARVGKDALEFDDRMSAGLEATAKLSVLVLRDAGKKGKFDSPWDFLRLTQDIQKRTTEDGAAVFTMGPLEFTLCETEPPALTGALPNVVLLDGGRTLTPELVAWLRDYVARGGGAILAADGRVDAANWNDALRRAELLPAALGRLRVEALGGERFETLARGQFGAGPLTAFDSVEDGDVAESRFYAWFETEAPAGNAAMLARFAGGQPFLLRKRPELGTVLLLTSGLNGRDNNLVVREFYFPFLFRLFSEAASGTNYARTVETGKPIRLRVADASVKGMTFSIEGQPPVALNPQPADGGLLAALPDGSSRSGLGSILVLGQSRVWFGIQGPRMDSDLTAVDSALKKKILQQLNMAECADGAQLEELLRAGRGGEEWHHWAVLVLLLALAGEMWLQRRFI